MAIRAPDGANKKDLINFLFKKFDLDEALTMYLWYTGYQVDAIEYVCKGKVKM